MDVNKPLVSLIVGAIILGIGPIFVRLSELGALATGFWRFALALPFLGLLCYWRPEPNSTERNTVPNFKDYLTIITAGGALGVDIAVWHLSLEYTTVAISTVLINIAPLLLVLWHWLVLRNPPSLKLLSGLGFSIVGILLLVHPRLQMEQTAVYGMLLALSGAVLYAIYILMMSKIRQKFSTFSAMFFSTFGAFLSMSLILGISDETFLPTTLPGYLIILGLAAGVHSFGQGLVLYAFARMPVTHSAALLLVQPLTASLLGFWLFGEQLDTVQILGMIMAFAGLTIISQARK